MKYLLLFCFLFLVGSNLYAVPGDTLATLHGKVYDQKTKQKIDAQVAVFFDTDITQSYSGSAAGGEFRMPIEDMGWYLISITAPGYLETTDTLWILNEHKGMINKEYGMTAIEVGLTVAIKNIYFNVNTASLSEQSFPELNNVVGFFVENSHIQFEIAGHTDAYGEEDYNLMLSQSRAQAVVDYLCSRGVNRTQLKAHGYGESKPVDTSGTKTGNAKNRRVEFTVLSIEGLTKN